MHGDGAKNVSLTQRERAEIDATDTRGILEDGLEHRLQLTGRTRYDAQYLGSRGLLLQRLPQLVEQPRVLDGDDGLGGEIRHQLDLFVGEWTYFLTKDRNGADHLVFLEHRHHEKCPCAAIVSQVDDRPKALDVAFIVANIRDLQNLFRHRKPGQRDLGPGVNYRFKFPYRDVCL